MQWFTRMASRPWTRKSTGSKINGLENQWTRKLTDQQTRISTALEIITEHLETVSGRNWRRQKLVHVKINNTQNLNSPLQ